MDGSLAIRSRLKLLVGLDYGTTYSGLAIALSNAADLLDVRPWTLWPGGETDNNEHLQKAPSRIAYASDNDDLDADAWGYEVEPGMKCYSWTKLLLDSSALPSEYDDSDLRSSTAPGLMALPSNKTAVDVVTDFMKGMNCMFGQAITQYMDKDGDLPMPVELWLTVPATWSEEAKWATRSAAIAAGFADRPGDEINLITEPEAAAYIALKSKLNDESDLVRPDTSILVCDCGGGTVDLATYTVMDVNPRPRLKESCVGEGGKCGGAFIDRNFFALMRERYGTSFTSLPPEQTGPGSRFMRQFESKKKAFTGTTTSRRPIKLSLIMPDAPASAPGYNKRLFEISLTRENMKGLFDPVVDKILDLITNQVRMTERRGAPRVETLILVGGLGLVPYLRDKVSEWCQSRNIRPSTPSGGGWSAIVRGAVLRGLEGSIVETKISRRHYGHTLSRKYEPSVHFNFDENKRHLWEDCDGDTLLSGFYFWELAKHSEINATTTIKSEFQTEHHEGEALTIDHKLFACSLDRAPETIEDSDVECIGTISGSYSDFDLTKFPSKVINGHKTYMISMSLLIALGEKSGTLKCRLMIRGREIGKTTIQFAHK